MRKGFKEEIAREIAKAIRAVYQERFADILTAVQTDEAGFEGFIVSKLEMPKDPRLGDYAFPTFLLSKALKEKPPDIARKIASGLDNKKYSVVGPYINGVISAADAAGKILPEIFESLDGYGGSSAGRGKTIVIDFSSPNIAKPFGVGHLRSTAVGNSLYRILQKLGYTCVGINHLGDWGTQFGKTILAYKMWGDRVQLEQHPVRHLYDLYARFHREEDQDPALSEEARAWFKKLEDGDTEAVTLWQTFKDYSLQEFKRIYEILDIRFDHYTGESFYNDKMDAVIERLQKAGLTTVSKGALIVDLEPYGMTPCLLRKADGATLYATRDLAGILYRYETFEFFRALYVVGAAQQEHFKQVFKVIELLGEEYAERLVHVEFGWIKFEDEAMSTRKGNIIFLDDVIETATAKAREVIKEKNPNLPDLDRIARMIGLGAIIFADLGVKRHKDVNFRWEEVLNFEGQTGPYLQYTHARLSALRRRYGKGVAAVDFQLYDTNPRLAALLWKSSFRLYDSSAEKELLMHLSRFGHTVELAGDRYEPNFIAEYLLELAAVFNRFYQRKDVDGRLIKIISENPEETKARMLLVSAVRIVMKEGLRLLGIQAPEEM